MDFEVNDATRPPPPPRNPGGHLLEFVLRDAGQEEPITYDPNGSRPKGEEEELLLEEKLPRTGL